MLSFFYLHSFNVKGEMDIDDGEADIDDGETGFI